MGQSKSSALPGSSDSNILLEPLSDIENSRRALMNYLNTSTYRLAESVTKMHLCDKRDDVELKCGHMFCAGCFIKRIDCKYQENETPRHEEAYSLFIQHTPRELKASFDNEGCENIEFICPKCFAYTKIGNPSLHPR